MHMANISRSLKMFLALTIAFFGVGLMAASADTDVSVFGSLGAGAGYAGSFTVNTSGGTTPGTGETITTGWVKIWGEGADNGTYNNILFNGDLNALYGVPIYLFSVGSYSDPY